VRRLLIRGDMGVVQPVGELVDHGDHTVDLPREKNGDLRLALAFHGAGEGDHAFRDGDVDGAGCQPQRALQHFLDHLVADLRVGPEEDLEQVAPG